MMKFLETHKRSIDYYNSYGLGDYKKGPRGLERKTSRSQNRANYEVPNNEETRKRHNSTEFNTFDAVPLAEETPQ